ncbi:nucleoside 2-deoxyribosyltransferase domain-containing protein [Lacrimispora amygdalina]|uniref:nucleoside 2-deoxyribosyltransferase domain-containing protein n=1 Tax=Lacrimispora amygdalina TaxID=253257 RepID=UPI000BE343FA|nr:nucleoside 2-deoxyribosyltransferase domain-containing protein [Lacrimispora amygdalina]
MIIKFSDQELYFNKNSIFLAGPTLRDSSFYYSWRKKACEILEQLGFTGTVYVPEFCEERKFREDDYIKQTKWEWACLDVAGVIAFWVPRCMENLPGLTTNIEFGIYIAKKADRLVLGHPEDAEKMKYMNLLYKEKTGRTSANTIEETLKEAMYYLSSLNASHYYNIVPKTDDTFGAF